jgi:hypothetical protein
MSLALLSAERPHFLFNGAIAGAPALAIRAQIVHF